MKIKIKNIIISIITIIMASMLMSLFAGCSGEVSFTTASLSDAYTCNSIDSSTKAPVIKSSVFSTNDSVIYCSVKLSNAPSDTEVKAQWIYVQGEVKDLNNYVINETPIKAEGTRYVSFSIEAPPSGWPKGDYLVKLFVDNQEKLTVNFKVSSTTASLSDAYMCKSVDSSAKTPIITSSVFATNDPVIYCSVKLSNAPSNTEIKAQWIYVQGEVKDMNNYVINETPIKAEGTRYVAFSLEVPASGWPKGDYLVKLFVDNQEKIKVNFKVQ
jgi:hypothetical protein